MSKFTHIIKRSGSKVPFKIERISNAIYRAAVAVGGRDQEIADYLAKKVVHKLETSLAENNLPTIEEIQDVVEEVLIKNGHAQVAKAYILYRNEQQQKRLEKSMEESTPSENIPWSSIWHALNWSQSHGLDSVAGLNQRIKNGEFPHIVHESEVAYEDSVYAASKLISARQDDLKMVFISGPSSSGKTTTTTKLEQKLKHTGLKFVPLNVDNYFFNLDLHPKDEFGDYDFETPQALDLELINQHLSDLCAGKEIDVPYYDFKTGLRSEETTKLHLEDNDILLIDCLHGLYPPMSTAIPDEKKFKLYLEPLLQMKDLDGDFIHWTDLRLIRRMLRDEAHRSYDPRQTLEHWHYVRSSELRNIIPYHGFADCIISSAMPYELPLYAAKMADKFALWANQYKDDPLKQDASKRAIRVNKLLQTICPIDDDSAVPGDSVLREFIGGSTLKY